MLGWVFQNQISFYEACLFQAGHHSCCPINSIKAVKENQRTDGISLKQSTDALSKPTVNDNQCIQCHLLVKADLITDTLSKTLSSLFSHPFSHLQLQWLHIH